MRGEISGFRGPHSSGHCYFALKDESAKIEAVIWKGVHGRMRFKPQEGLEVIATGKLTTYPGSSKYQIVIEAIEPAGIGALMALMEERKRKLAAEGLFDEARKQLLPWLPEVIGVVTSPTGAVIRDILHRLAGPFSAPRAGVAGAGAGRRLGRAGRRRDPRLQRAAARRRDAAAGPADRRARRRLARGSVVVQRRDRGARRGREHDPADLGGRPRDRHHADRFRRRQARADADRRRRNGGAGARRTVRRGRDAWRGARIAVLAARPGRPPQRIARRRARAARRLSDLLAIPRQRLDGAATALPRALKANTHAAFPPLRRDQRAADPAGAARAVAQARHRLTVSGERMRAFGAESLLRNRRRPLRRSGSPAEGLKTRQRAGAAQRHRARPRAGAAAGRARAARARHRHATAQARVAHSGQLLGALSYRSVLARGFALVRDDGGQPLHAAASVGRGRAAQHLEFSDGRVAAADADGADAPAAKPSRRAEAVAQAIVKPAGRAVLF